MPRDPQGPVQFHYGGRGKEPTCRCKKYKGCGSEPWVERSPGEGLMTGHSNILASRIPRTEEPCRLQCLGSQRVKHDWNDLAGKKKKWNLIIEICTYVHWDMWLECLTERWKTLFYLLCVRNYAETLATLPTDLQILSHWATGAPIFIHSVAKTAFTSGPLDTALTLGGKRWSCKDITSALGEEGRAAVGTG